MKKIIISLGVIGIVAAAAIGGTIAYFSDTEANMGNLFKAGTVDINVEGDNFTWSSGATLEDMKPCYTDYINFTIHNNGSDPNPVNVWKKLTLDPQGSGTGVASEPECSEQGGVVNGNACDFTGCTQSEETTCTDNNDIATIINYDLSVTVYDNKGLEIWKQTIYTDDEDVTVSSIMGATDGVYLGMIPAGGKMEVVQSYHMQDPNEPTNWAQGDIMDFDIEVKAVQLRGTAWLDNKTTNTDPWNILQDDDFKGVLTYEVKNPTFDFSFTGKAPLPNTEYCLFVGGVATGPSWDPDTNIGCAISNTDGNIEIADNINLGKDMKNVKAWLVSGNNGSAITNWGSMSNWLWETGMIWYEDTDVTL